MMLQFLLVLSQISFIAGFSKCRFSNQHVVITPSSRASVLHMAASDQNRPRVKVQRIVESLSSGMKSASEVELQLKALQADGTLLDLSTAVAGSLIGLISGGYFDAVLAHGDAPWAGPFLYAVLGGGAYYGAIQKTNADVSVKLRKYLGKPTLNAAKSSISKIQTAVAEAKASAVKKVEETVDDIVAIPTKIRDSFLDATDEAIAIFLAIPVNVQNAVTKSYQDAKEIAIQRVDDEVDSIVGAKDEAIANFIAIPVNIQSAATKSYQDAIQSAIQRVDDKVAELKAIPVTIQEKSATAAKNAQIRASQKAEDIVGDIKATPKRLLDAAILKAAETATDIRNIPDVAISKVQNAYDAKKLEINITIDRKVKTLVESVIPSEANIM